MQATVTIAGDPAIVCGQILHRIGEINHRIGVKRRWIGGRKRDYQFTANEIRLEFRSEIVELGRLRTELRRLKSCNNTAEDQDKSANQRV